VPPGWSVVTGGARRSTDAEEAAGTYRVAVEDPTYFTFLAGRYTAVRRGGPVPLSAHLLTSRENMPAWLDGVVRMLDVLVAEFGPFRFDSLALVEVPRDIARKAGFNAFSAHGVLALNHRAFNVPDTKVLLEWLGHELGHQWFPHIVQFDTPPGYFMEETLAEYGGLRIVETLGGPQAATRLRRTGYEYDPIYSALAYFRLVGAGVDAPIGNLEPREGHRDLAYTKGALVFDMLSRELGRDAFRRILNDITRRHGERRVPWPTFLDEIERGAGRDLDWFYEQWFRRTGAPDFALTWSQDGDRVRGRITQPPPFYRARLSLEVNGAAGSGSTTHTVEIDGATAEFAIRLPFRVTEIALDPAYEVLRWTPEYRAAADSVRAAASGN
jgi:aminopeptidase N